MRTFETHIRGRSFWLAVILPPVGYFGLVMALAQTTGVEPVAPEVLMVITALAYLLPISALGWVLLSASAYSVRPGQLIEHSVLRDRVVSLPPELWPAWIGDRTVEFRVHRRLRRVHVKEPLAFLVALRLASLPTQ